MKIWMHPRESALMLKYMPPAARVLEWGSGGSSIWFAHRAAFVASIEHADKWHTKVLAHAAICRLTNLHVHHRSGESEYVAAGAELIKRYGPFDFVLIDGIHRPACAEAAAEFIPAGGLLAMHDYYMPGRESYHVAEKWFNVIDSIRDTTQTIAILRRK